MVLRSDPGQELESRYPSSATVPTTPGYLIPSWSTPWYFLAWPLLACSIPTKATVWNIFPLIQNGSHLGRCPFSYHSTKFQSLEKGLVLDKLLVSFLFILVIENIQPNIKVFKDILTLPIMKIFSIKLYYSFSEFHRGILLDLQRPDNPKYS